MKKRRPKLITAEDFSETDKILKPCPFCGNRPSWIVTKVRYTWRGPETTFQKIECGACNLTVEEIPGVKDAREIWNKRKPIVEDMEPVRHGEWIQVLLFEKFPLRCSVCGYERFSKTNMKYCPECGAKMKGVSE